MCACPSVCGCMCMCMYIHVYTYQCVKMFSPWVRFEFPQNIICVFFGTSSEQKLNCWLPYTTYIKQEEGKHRNCMIKNVGLNNTKFLMFIHIVEKWVDREIWPSCVCGLWYAVLHTFFTIYYIIILYYSYNL